MKIKRIFEQIPTVLLFLLQKNTDVVMMTRKKTKQAKNNVLLITIEINGKRLLS
jgi:hypothetical protein